MRRVSLLLVGLLVGLAIASTFAQAGPSLAAYYQVVYSSGTKVAGKQGLNFVGATVDNTTMAGATTITIPTGVPTTRSIIGGGALAGGGTLAADRTIVVHDGGVTNAMLANPSITVTAPADGGALVVGSPVALGGTLYVQSQTTPAQLALKSPLASPTFTGTVSLPTALTLATGTTGTAAFTGGVNNTGTNIVAHITNSSGTSSVGLAGLAVDTGYALEAQYYAVAIGDTWAGYTCSNATGMQVDTNGVTLQNVVVWSGAGKVQNAGASANLTTIAGVAMQTVGNGGLAKICTHGFAAVNSETDCSTAGLPAGTSGSNAGKVQCTTAPPANSRLGRTAIVVSSGVAVVFIE